jgi:HEAT repeat protein
MRGLSIVAVVAVGLMISRAPGGADNRRIETLLQEQQYEQALASAMNGGQVDPKRAADIARRLLGVALQQSDPTIRWYALRAAVRLRDPALLDAVRPTARSPDRYEQALALDLLANTDPSLAREELLEALASPYRAIRLRGIQGLARLRDPTLVDRFDRVLTNDPDPDLRLFAVRALLECGTDSVIPLLHRGLDDKVDAVREESVKALVQLGDHGVRAVVRRRIAEDTAPDERAFALRLAGHIPDPALLNDVAPFLADPNPEVRAAAAGAVLSIAALTEQLGR